MQQRTSLQLLYITLALTTGACRKATLNITGAASLTIINAVPGVSELALNLNGAQPPNNFYINAKKIAYNVFQPDYQLNAYSGTQRFLLYNYPDTLPQSRPFADVTLDLPVGSINTLFVAGTTSRPDTLFIREQLPHHQTADSTMGIRFINLSPGSQPVSINLAEQAPGSEIASLPYKGVSGFRRYPATSDISSYTFEFRDKASGALLGSYIAEGINNDSSNPFDPVNRWRNRNCTLALLGLPNDGSGNNTQVVLLINNY
jgi:Domain of unknown function (DUF4397)